MKIISMLPWADWLGLVCFLSMWVGYAWVAKVRGMRDLSLIATTNRYRQLWMVQATGRDPRMLDGLITQNLSQTPAFFSSTSIIIIGGLFALLGTTDKAAEFVREIPFSQATPILVFEFKILVLISIFVYAFFRFSWSMRQYTFVSLMIGALPPIEFFKAHPNEQIDYAERVAAMTGLAAETFNDGLRSYYFAFAVMGWFFSPMAFVLTTVLIVGILYNREFRSDVLEVLNDGN